MRRPKHRLRALMLLWQHSWNICSVFILIGIFMVLYQVTRDANRIDNTSGVNLQRRLGQLFEIDHRGNNFNHVQGNVSSRFTVKKDSNGFQENQDNMTVNQQTANQEKNRANPDTYKQDSVIYHRGVNHKDIAHQYRDIDRQGVEHKKIVHQNQRHDVQRRDIVQQDQLNPDADFTAHDYPLNVNMTDIIRQYDMKGYADEQPINAFDHHYIINPDQTCNQSDSIKVLFIVKSSPDHTLRRVTIRETWANRKRFPWIRVIFSFGIPQRGKSLVHLKEESATFNDILLVNYVDDYYNLTLKTISGLKWAVTHCAPAEYVLSVDDDLYVAPDLLLRFLNRPNVRKVDNLFSGHLIINTKPIRNDQSKWRVWKSEYPFQNYPSYIFGGFVIMSMSTVRTFTVAAMYTKLFKFEDVYLGILAAKVGIEATNNGYVNSMKTFTVSESFKTLIASHFYYDPKDLQRAWDCHLSILDQDDDKAIFCDYIGDRLRRLQAEINNIVGWLNYINPRY